MNSKPSLSHSATPAVMAFCAITLVIILVALRPGPQVSPKQTKPAMPVNGNQQNNNNLKVRSVMSVKMLEQLMQKAHSDKLYLDIYPIKQSTDINKKDFLLLTIPLNAKGEPIEANREANKARIEKGVACYANFLHRNNIRANTIPLGYQLAIDRSRLKGKATLDINIFVLQPFSNRVYLMPPLPQPLYSDSMPICKCPPGCAETACIYNVELARIAAREFNTKMASH